MTGKKASRRASGASRNARSLSTDEELHRIRELLTLMKEHDLEELEIGPDGTSLRLSKRGPVPAGPAYAGMPAPALAPAAAPVAAESATEEDDAATDPNLETFVSPMVGTFYRKPTPEAAAFVVEGDRVQDDTALCIIEAMKVFNEIRAEMRGTVVEILVDNGEAVEYGQPLFILRKA